MARWRSVGVVTLVALVVVTATLVMHAASSSSGIGGASQKAASYFLGRYDTAQGRVVRLDQGGDTVSEGQAYAMLVSVALDDQARFAATWRWTRDHLQQPDGLLAWRWDAGRVSDPQSAADADVDTAWALTLAAEQFGDPGYRTAAGRITGAVMKREVVDGRDGPALVAGPWAVGPPAHVDPSYDAPVDFAALAGGVPGSGAWSRLAAGERQDMRELLAGRHLPPDWAIVGSDRLIHPTSAPDDPGGAVRYGFDAARVPVRLAASCDPDDRNLAAGLWTVLSGPVERHQPLVNLDLGGSPASGASTNPVGLVGASAAAHAAGRGATADRLLDQAQAANARQPTYYGSAWVALGRLLLQTQRLGGCGQG